MRSFFLALLFIFLTSVHCHKPGSKHRSRTIKQEISGGGWALHTGKLDEDVHGTIDSLSYFSGLVVGNKGRYKLTDTTGNVEAEVVRVVSFEERIVIQIRVPDYDVEFYCDRYYEEHDIDKEEPRYDCKKFKLPKARR